MWLTTDICVYLIGIFLLSRGNCCPSGWLDYRDSCYEIISYVLPKQQAEYSCSHNGAILASISGPGKLAFLGSQVSLSNQDYFWVGLLKISGNVTWNDGTDATNLPWIDVPTETSNGSCFVFYKGKVVPRDCDFPSAYICEIKKSFMTENPKGVCPQGTTTYDDKCFWQITQSMAHDAIEKECADKKGYLAVLNFESKKDYVISQIHLRPGKYWIGLNKNGSDYVWETGERINRTHPPWPIGQTLTGTGECFVIQTNSSSAFGIQWKLEDCKNNAFGLCEREPEIITPLTTPVSSTTESTPRCPSHYSWKADEESNNCYWETSYETERLSWEDARKYCQSYGGDLASFQSLREEKNWSQLSIRYFGAFILDWSET
uniref:U37-Liphistoxin-Lth1a_1 n=1 Tax=Liphistius thaleban TaxID=1905330 RepID=A0A4Q8K3M2_9ARAC